MELSIIVYRFDTSIAYAAMRMRQWVENNAKLKRIMADLSPDKPMLQDVLAKKHRGLPPGVNSLTG